MATLGWKSVALKLHCGDRDGDTRPGIVEFHQHTQLSHHAGGKYRQNYSPKPPAFKMDMKSNQFHQSLRLKVTQHGSCGTTITPTLSPYLSHLANQPGQLYLASLP
jgi:hypothetical protein